MKQIRSQLLILGALVLGQEILVEHLGARWGGHAGGSSRPEQSPGALSAYLIGQSGNDPGMAASITIDYPAEGSIFPPDIAAPTFMWRDASDAPTAWRIEVEFADGSPGMRLTSRGDRAHVGNVDPQCISETNELPQLAPPLDAARTWTPDGETWEAIKQHSLGRAALVTITGFGGRDPDHALSRGRVAIQTSRDPVGAPVFYRDVPLMPSELEKGVIKPLVPSALPLIAWRLRDISQTSSRLLMDHLPTCANCHSFSLDGKTLGMDLDGPQNDKSLYAIARVVPQMSIRDEDVITWNSFAGMPAGRRTIAFMPQLSPDGRHAVATVDEEVYVANFKDYRFLQVFYPTRGILAWYSRETRRLQALPGADNPHYVHTNAAWSPDGKYLAFARAKAKASYPAGRKMAGYANDPNETPIRYDLYRIPFNEGRGGRPWPIPGASGNGMSNSFPRVSPDGRWIVFVQSRNGQLMRPDSQLYIVPGEGGKARRMRCNTPLMNSWHSFSPNGRWMVFASKGRSPYTQMFLTHLDEEGNDSPPILIENATAANRAVNLPEFVNIRAEGLLKIDIPAAEFYRLFDRAWNLGEKGQYEAAVVEWKKALAISPNDAKAHNNLGSVLWRKGAFDDAIAHYLKALEVKSDYLEARNNLGVALVRQGRFGEAVSHFQRALEQDPGSATLHANLGRALAGKLEFGAAMEQWRRALELSPDSADVYNDLGTALFRKGRLDQAIAHWRRAVEIDPGFVQARYNLGRALAQKGRPEEAISNWQKALEISPGFSQAHFSLGEVLYSQGKIQEALQQWRQGLRIEPDRLSVLNRAAWVLATSPEASVRNGTEAVALAERATRLSGEAEPAALDALAAAYAEAGRFPEAVQAARRALAMASQQDQQSLAAALKARIAHYESGTPFREMTPPAASGRLRR